MMLTLNPVNQEYNFFFSNHTNQTCDLCLHDEDVSLPVQLILDAWRVRWLRGTFGNGWRATYRRGVMVGNYLFVVMQCSGTPR